MNQHIDQALHSFRERTAHIARYERYYRGEHNLSFASEKFQNTFGTLFREFAMNLCPAVVDAVCDKLTIRGFGVEDRVSSPTVREGSSGALTDVRGTDTIANSIWSDNLMQIRSAEVHREALKTGEAFAIVWPDADGRPTIYPNRSGSCVAVYDDENPGKIQWAAKYWQASDKRIRLNLFYPDRIEKYISKRPSEAALPDASDFIPFVGARASMPADGFRASHSMQAGMPAFRQARTPRSDNVIPNSYGVVPVFHFANNSDLAAAGRSELEDAIPIQDGLNKSVLDMLVAMEFSSYRQRWTAGIEIEYDKDGNAIAPFKAGIDHVWIAADPGARFGDFGTAELEQFLKVKDSFRVDIASVTGTPLHYLLPYANEFPSGEALRKAETRFVAKVRSRQLSYGRVWADAMSLALRIGGQENLRLKTEWDDPAAMSEREILENILLKKQIGLSTEEALRQAEA
jgi:hypothetical protein